MEIAVRWVYWLNFSIIYLLIEAKQNIFQLVDHQFSDDWMPFEWNLFDKWKLIVKLITFQSILLLNQTNKKKFKKKLKWIDFICFRFIFSSNCLIFIDFETIWKNEKKMRNRMNVWWEEEHHNFLPSLSLSISVSR